MSRSHSTQPHVDFRHLRTFLVVVEELNFSRAAKRLGVSQPPLSRQIKRLEDSLNVQLFDRSRTQIRLTEAGKVFADSARQIISQLEQSILETQLIASGCAGVIAVGVDGTDLACYKATQFVADYQKHFPNVKIQIRDLTANEQIEALQCKTISLGFVNPLAFATETVPAEIACAAISQDDLAVVLPESHVLANQPSIMLSELRHEPVMIARSLQQILGTTTELSEQSLLKLSINQEARSCCLTLGLVASGQGLSLIPSSTQSLVSGQAILYRPLQPAVRVDDLSAIWRYDESRSVVLSFVELLREKNIEINTP